MWAWEEETPDRGAMQGSQEKVQGFPGLGERTQWRKKEAGLAVDVQRAQKPRGEGADLGSALTGHRLA